jgi:hypothetical protein
MIARVTKAKGTISREKKSRSIAIHFDPDIFEAIAAEAAARGRSFGEQARIYIGRGMDAKPDE